jgi:hypothetical protein
MTNRHTKAPPRPMQETDDEGLATARLCIRVMERFLDAVDDNPKTRPAYIDLIDLYMDVLQDELAPFAFDLAYELFSENDEVAKRRREETQES